MSVDTRAGRSTALIAASFFGMTGVILGAFGAHGLRDKIEPRLLEVFITGTHYQMLHALALLAIARQGAPQISAWVARLWIAGVVIFSGSLYILALSGVKLWGAVTPFGGVALILGWAILLKQALSAKSGASPGVSK